MTKDSPKQRFPGSAIKVPSTKLPGTPPGLELPPSLLYGVTRKHGPYVLLVGADLKNRPLHHLRIPIIEEGQSNEDTEREPPANSE